MSAGSRLGPVLSGTVVTPDANAAVERHRRAFDLHVVADGPVPADVAQAWGAPRLAGRRMVQMGADPADPSTHWLRLLEVPGSVPPAPMSTGGWLALEVLVRDVHALADRMADSGYRVLGAPRPLSVGDNLWAMQVAGPDGEVYYLTEVRAPVPPFELPAPARHVAERLFIPVLSAPDRDAALAWYEALAGGSGLRFDARAAALARCLGQDPELRRPMGSLQLAGRTLVEIDHVPEHPPAPRPPAGVAVVSIVADAAVPLPPGAAWHGIAPDTRWPAARIALLRGPAGEDIELLCPTPN
jgi:hypothetical protein